MGAAELSDRDMTHDGQLLIQTADLPLKENDNLARFMNSTRASDMPEIRPPVVVEDPHVKAVRARREASESAAIQEALERYSLVSKKTGETSTATSVGITPVSG